MMQPFRKKPIVVEAIQINAGDLATLEAVFAADSRVAIVVDEDERVVAVEIETLEGTMRGNAGDWIIRGVKGELYPCKPEVFRATYEPASADVSGFGQAPRTVTVPIILNADEVAARFVEKLQMRCRMEYLEPQTNAEIAEVYAPCLVCEKVLGYSPPTCEHTRRVLSPAELALLRGNTQP